MVESRERFTANNADIGEMCARVERFLAHAGMEERERTRVRLTMERLLRRVSERRGWGTRCELTLGRRWGRVFIRLSYLGDAFDPTLVGRESESEAWSARLLTDLGLVPEWSWRRGVNSLLLRPRARERRALVAPLLAIALGVLLRVALAAAGNGWAEAAERLVFAPLLRAFLGAAGTLAALKVFFSALSTVCGAAETASGRVGRLAVARFLAFDALCALLGTAALAALFRVNFAGGSDAPLLWGLIPADPVSPLQTVDAPQLALLGAAFGAALHALGGRAERLREWAEQCDAALATLWEALCRLTPAAICAAVCRVPAATLPRGWKPLAAFALYAAFAALCALLAAAIRLRVRPRRLPGRLLPPAASALRAGSFAAALGGTMDNCENALGIAHPTVLTGLSAGTVLWKGVAALCLPAATLFFTAERGAAAGVGSLTLTALAGFAFAVALPERPGTLLLAFAFMPAGVERSTDALALMAALDVFLSALRAFFTVLTLQCELLLQAERLDMRNDKVLR